MIVVRISFTYSSGAAPVRMMPSCSTTMYCIASTTGTFLPTGQSRASAPSVIATSSL